LTSFEKSEKSIEWFLSNVERVSLSLQLSEPVQNFLYNEYSDPIQNISIQQNLIKQIDNIISTYNYINAVIFFKTNGDVGGSSSPRTYFHSRIQHPFYSTDEYKEACEGQTRMTWISGYMRDYFSMYPLENASEKDIMIVGLRTIGDQTWATKGNEESNLKSNVMLVSISEPAFRKFFDNLADEGTEVSVLDRSGKQISGTVFSKFGKVPDYYDYIDMGSDFGSFTIDTTKDGKQIIYYRMKSTGWVLVKEVPLSVYSKTANRIRYVMVFIFVGTLFTIVSVYTIWVLQFSKPFEELTKSMYAVGQGQLDRRIEVKSEIYEIGLINDAFNDMINNLNRLIIKNKEIERKKQELEFKNLQNQINPHFIYNTITSIRWLAMLSGAKNVDSALVSFVQLLRPVFSQKNTTWTLREELDYIKNYIDLMKLRFGGNISYVVVGQKEYSELRLPRFILQPILENCFQHAVGTGNSLSIIIYIKKRDNKYEIIVEDNGTGMDEDKIKQLNHMFEADTLEILAGEKSEHTPIGLYNVNRRLKLRYGDDSGLKIDENYKVGTRIHVYISNNDLL